MEKLLFDILQIIVVTKVTYSLIKWTFKKKKKRNKKSIAGKVVSLVSNKIHHKLENALRTQRDSQDPNYGKVIPLTKTR